MTDRGSSPASRVDDRPIPPDDPRYTELVTRGFNRRFVPRHDVFPGPTEWQALSSACNESASTTL